jgi:outer membrane lipoprotein-sorting protein
MNSRSFLRKSALALLGASLALAAPAQAAPDAGEIMKKVYGSPKPATSVITMTMVISKGSQKLKRTLTTWSAGDNAKGETERITMKFLSPADVKGSGFLNTKRPDGSTESLLWLPALGRVRRLGSGGSDQDQSFFGSDFTNRDINGFVESDFSYALAGSESGFYTVEATPKKSIGFDKLVYRIDSSTWKYVKIEYWRSGKLAKAQTDEYAKVGAYYMPSRIVMNSSTKSSTELTFTDYKLDQDLGDQYFTERFLKQ